MSVGQDEAQASEFTVTSEEAREWITHLCRDAPYFTVALTGEWITPAQVRAINAEC